MSLPASAVCWSWKPCADHQGGYGYGAPPTESQSLLPPLPPGGAPPPGSPTGQQGAPAAPGPAGAPEKLTPKKPEATAKAAPAPAKPKPKPAPAPAQAKAVPPPAPAPAPAQAKAVPPPQPQPVPAQAKAVPPPAPVPQGTSTGQGAAGSGSATRTCSGGKACASSGCGSGGNVNGARHGNDSGDPRIGTGTERPDAAGASRDRSDLPSLRTGAALTLLPWEGGPQQRWYRAASSRPRRRMSFCESPPRFLIQARTPAG
jgi:hypothetical protein